MQALGGDSFTHAETVKLPVLSSGGIWGAVAASESLVPVSERAEVPETQVGLGEGTEPQPACAPSVASWPLPVASRAALPLPSSSFHQASSGVGLFAGRTLVMDNSAGGELDVSGLRLPARSTACTYSVRLPFHTGEIGTLAGPPSWMAGTKLMGGSLKP